MKCSIICEHGARLLDITGPALTHCDVSEYSLAELRAGLQTRSLIINTVICLFRQIAEEALASADQSAVLLMLQHLWPFVA